MSKDSFHMHPVAHVRGGRAEPEDDAWGGVVARIELDAARFGAEALAGIDAFSHLEVVYVFHRVPEDEVQEGARHPRGNTEWPRVGIFAQRGKGRPNRLGVSRCRLLGVEGTVLAVQGLDAIDGTPVLDIKPWCAEFAPIGPVRQPRWITELMAHYHD
jgi:tRNA-Thr(GGU) m(6)t(6)A37 methyltransferase TsaA